MSLVEMAPNWGTVERADDGAGQTGGLRGGDRGDLRGAEAAGEGGDLARGERADLGGCQGAGRGGGQRRGLIAGERGDVLGGDRLDLCGAEGTDDGAGERGKLRGAQRADLRGGERGADRVELVGGEGADVPWWKMAPNWALSSVLMTVLVRPEACAVVIAGDLRGAEAAGEGGDLARESAPTWAVVRAPAEVAANAVV